MKKTLIILLTIMFISSLGLCAQTNNDIYIIGTSVLSPIKSVTGLNKNTLPVESGERNPTLVFRISFVGDVYYNLEFWHHDYNHVPNDIVDLPLSRLSDFTLIEVDDFIVTHDKMQALKWYQTAFDQTSFENEGKKRIWIIDRNDFYKSSPSLTEPDRMKLIPVIIYPESLPNPRIID